MKYRYHEEVKFMGIEPIKFDRWLVFLIAFLILWVANILAVILAIGVPISSYSTIISLLKALFNVDKFSITVTATLCFVKGIIIIYSKENFDKKLKMLNYFSVYAVFIAILTFIL